MNGKLRAGPTMKPIIKILRDAGRVMPEGWLFLPEDGEWGHDTEGAIIDCDSLEETEFDGREMPIFAVQKGLVETLDGGTLSEIYHCAARLEDPLSDETLLEAFDYYYKFDAFLPQAGAPDPPSNEEILVNIDRRFYNSLGGESLEILCRHDGCQRGTVRFSVFCRVHHFEKLQGKVCPFED